MKHSYLIWSAFGLLLGGPLASQAQTGGVRIGTAGAPDASAVLDLRPDASAAPKGLLPPRLTLAQRNAIGGPAPGLVVYQTDNVPGLYVYNGSLWVLQADNLGNHTATQNLNLGTNMLVGNGGSQGLSISSVGALATSSSITAGQGLIADASQANSGTLSPGLRLGGSTSGEGLASKRNAGGNQYGLDFYTSAINRLSISKDGRIGIGNTSPATLLDLGNTGGSSATDVAAKKFAVYGAGTDFYGLGISAYYLHLYVGDISSAPVMSLGQSGNVGIGTSVPGQSLELAGRAAPTLLLHSTGNNLVNGATLQLRENDLTYGWNLRHNNGGSEGGTTDDRLVLESANGGATTPVMTWN